MVGEERTRDGKAFCAHCTACKKAICTHYSGEWETWHAEGGDAYAITAFRLSIRSGPSRPRS